MIRAWQPITQSDVSRKMGIFRLRQYTSNPAVSMHCHADRAFKTVRSTHMLAMGTQTDFDHAYYAT